MSSIGGVIDSMKHSEKDFPKGLIISSLFTIVSYVLTDFSVNYQRDIVQTGANTGNITYVVYGRQCIVFVEIIVCTGIIFTVLQPLLEHRYATAF